jgi:hypothetical protein
MRIAFTGSCSDNKMETVEMSISLGTVWVVLVILNLVGMTIAAYRILRKK